LALSIAAIQPNRIKVKIVVKYWGHWVMRCWCSYPSAAKCKWWCHRHPIKIQNGSAFLLPAYPGYPGKEAIKWVY